MCTKQHLKCMPQVISFPSLYDRGLEVQSLHDKHSQSSLATVTLCERQKKEKEREKEREKRHMQNAVRHSQNNCKTVTD
jgi:hypothetical protein